jgi:hypothetical protein
VRPQFCVIRKKAMEEIWDQATYGYKRNSTFLEKPYKNPNGEANEWVDDVQRNLA